VVQVFIVVDFSQQISEISVESKEELKNFLMSVKEESEKAGLKLNI